MDDHTALERQIAVVLGRMGGPEPMFDALAITRTAATQSPKWRFQAMFSANKLAAAAAIVALFGGLLLTGVVTIRQSDEMAPAGSSWEHLAWWPDIRMPWGAGTISYSYEREPLALFVRADGGAATSDGEWTPLVIPGLSDPDPAGLRVWTLGDTLFVWHGRRDGLVERDLWVIELEPDDAAASGG